MNQMVCESFYCLEHFVVFDTFKKHNTKMTRFSRVNSPRRAYLVAVSPISCSFPYSPRLRMHFTPRKGRSVSKNISFLENMIDFSSTSEIEFNLVGN